MALGMRCLYAKNYFMNGFRYKSELMVHRGFGFTYFIICSRLHLAVK